MLAAIDFSEYERNQKYYGGSERKEGITIDGEDYMIKYQKQTAFGKRNNHISEFIGSHIFELCGIQAHKTYLGYRNGEQVVACKDFNATDKQFVPFNDVGESTLDQDKENYQYDYEDITAKISDAVFHALTDRMGCIILQIAIIQGVNKMREAVTRGDICLTDEYNFTYKVAEIVYTEREDESFFYEIRPNYSVISLLSANDFQGIPGLNLDLKKELYIRENITPVFISERAPGKNREDLWELLKQCDMQYLNQLEWLIRTDTRYSGDKLFVQRPENKSIKVESIRMLGDRSAVICRKILEVICYGDTVTSPTFVIDDKNRKQYFDLLMVLYSTERKFLDSRRRDGIAASAKKGNYKGRKKARIDKLAAQEIFLDYAIKKISSKEAAEKLGVSKSTFLRRYRENKESPR